MFCLLLDIYGPITFRLDTAVFTTELYILVPVQMKMTFNQGCEGTRKQKLCSHYLTKTSIDRDKNRYAVNICHFDVAYFHLIRKEMISFGSCLLKKEGKKKEQMLKRPIVAILTGLLCRNLRYTINHREHLTLYMQLYNRMNVQALAFP